MNKNLKSCFFLLNNDGEWETDCGEIIMDSLDVSIMLKDFLYCPYCGRRIKNEN